MAITQLDTATAQALGQQVGFTGAYGGGAFDAWLNANPAAKQQYQQKYNEALAKANTPVSITDYNSSQVQNPQLPVNAEQVPVTQTAQANEFTNPNQFNLNANQGGIDSSGLANTTAPTVQGQNATASQVNAEEITAGIDPNKGQYEATKVSGQTPQAQAQQGQVDPVNATVQGQLAKLMDFTGGIPKWAEGSVAYAEGKLAARGLGASSIGAGAITAAIQQAALPIAAADANTYFQMDLKNLDNRQQTELLNTQLKQQSLLSDQSAENASKQFNAQSASQTQQFIASLVGSIKTNNAQLATSVSTFNAAETNKINAQNANNEIAVQQFNKQQELAVRQFNATLQNNREQFNSQMQSVIDQSNVNWRRSINTSNTVAANAANQTNAQNRFNMSQTAMNNIWQQFRDEAAWAFQMSETAKDREYNMAQAANNRSFVSGQNDENLAYSLGASAISYLLK